MATFRGDVFKASILAVLIVSGLGAASYLLQAHKLTLTLDLYTQKDGKGPGIPSGPFFYNETVTLIAFVKESTDTSVKDALVEFRINGPHSINFQHASKTNVEGIGTVNLTIPYNQYEPENVIGVWNVAAWVDIGEENVTDFLALEVKAFPPPSIDVYTNRGGWGHDVLSESFSYNETITIYAYVTDFANASVANVSVEFQVQGPLNFYRNITYEEETNTNTWGIGVLNLNLTKEFDLEHPQAVIGVWKIIATVQIVDMSVDTLIFEVRMPPTPSIDVFTDEGGRGPNKPSQPFYSLQNVTLYAEVTDGKYPLAGVLVAFAVKNYEKNWTLPYAAKETDSSGIATFSFTIANTTITPEWLGIWIVYTNVEIGSQVYIDTLTFEVKPTE